MLDYQSILNKNLVNVLIDILKILENKNIKSDYKLYITFDTNFNSVKIPEWLKKKYPNEITIVLQYEYYNLKVRKDGFSITLSFENIPTDLSIGYNSVISFADPISNFGLKLKNSDNNNNITKKDERSGNVINLKDFKKI